MFSAANPCEEHACADPYSTCEVVDGKASCACPAVCTADVRPVCGTNRQTYDNECKMRADACQQGMMIRVKYEGECTGEAGWGGGGSGEGRRGRGRRDACQQGMMIRVKYEGEYTGEGGGGRDRGGRGVRGRSYACQQGMVIRGKCEKFCCSPQFSRGEKSTGNACCAG